MVISVELYHRRIHHTNEGSKTLSNFSSWSKVFSSYLRSECMIVAGLVTLPQRMCATRPTVHGQSCPREVNAPGPSPPTCGWIRYTAANDGRHSSHEKTFASNPQQTAKTAGGIVRLGAVVV